MSEFSLTIAGEVAAAESVLAVINPATGKPFADCPDATRAQLDAALEAAADALKTRRADVGVRRATLVRCGDALQAPAPASLARAAKFGDGMEPGVEYGPINNLPQRERVRELVDDAKDAGARIVTGGAALDREGYFYAPTIVADVEEGVRLVDEEQFGPALPVISYRDVDDAIVRANATHFGLGGSVWTSDLERGADLARRLECGTGWVNQHLNLVPNAPFGGSKWSGIGVENGPWGLAAFTEYQVINVAKS